MENSFEERERLERAKKKVKSIKGFYRHLTVYLFVNAFILISRAIGMEPGEDFWRWGTFSTALFWGMGLLLHAASVFGTTIFFGSDWEERKLNEILEKNKKAKKENRWE
ncbi:2TM domain-containing protein [Flavobacterium alkalisoli]|uniref:2TM domain-containing protein n=1 Tax=Flavobacterium alkalisoli TaxID=2602769 RepID=A0A5B9FYE6_9FLAO|nr:2TM domain-containing protein [Flavobacterium alkalisoli]QEE51351.1 2TM domain-containing protein [Flavobacterium alkalisoli]